MAYVVTKLAKVRKILTVETNSYTVDSKIDENRCKQKCKLFQVMGTLYSYISFLAR